MFKNPEKLTPLVKYDREKLVMVLTNLLSNAYKFTPEGGKVEIKITTLKKPKAIKVTISDTGTGIPLDKQKFIFNKFQQADNPLQKSYSGSGLGLNITKQIIEKLGGEIWVESEGKIKSGSRFHFTITTL